MQYKVGDQFRVVGNHPENSGYEGWVGTISGIVEPGIYSVMWGYGVTSPRWRDIGDMSLMKRNGTLVGIDMGAQINKKYEEAQFSWTCTDNNKDNNNTKMEKFYRAKVAMPAFEVGAVVKNTNGSTYQPVNELYLTDAGTTWYERKDGRMSAILIENAPDFWERVYPVNLLTKTVFKLKAEAQELFSKEQAA